MAKPRQGLLTLGLGVWAWIEHYLVHGPGDVQGQPVRLGDELVAFLMRAYEVTPTGRRRYRRVFLSRAKGWSKTELAAMIGCAELLGPVRCDGFDAEGRPVGRPVISPEVLCFATEFGQAGTTFDTALFMLRHGRAEDDHRIDAGLTRVLVAGGGIMEPMSASAPSKDGARSTHVCFDETHLWTTPALHRLHATVRRNLAKRSDAWSLETSTMYRPGEASVAEGTHSYAKLIAEGRAADEGLWFDHREAPAVPDLDDIAVLRAALEDGYGAASDWVDVDRLLAEASDPQTDEADFRRYFLNQATVATEAWLDPARFASVGHPDEELEGGERVALGFDGSRSEDGTALIACRISDGRLFTLGVWEPDRAGWEVPRSEVDAVVADAFARFEVARLYADPPYWMDYVDRWALEWPDRVVSWYTNRDRAMAAATERFHTAVMDGSLSHDAHPTLMRHAANARRKEVRAGVIVRKEAPGSPRKIDAVVAAILAYEARADVLASGRPTRSAYEERQMVVA